MPKHIAHLAISGSGLKLPFGPITPPRPGPTFEMAVAAPENAVVKSSPVKARNSDKNTKQSIYK